MYRDRRVTWYVHLDFILFDILSFEVAYLLAFFLRHGTLETMGDRDGIYLYGFIIIAILDFFISIIMGTFENVLRRGLYREFRKTVFHGASVTMIFIVVLFMCKLTTEYSRAVFILTYFLYIAVSYIIRIVWKKMIRKFDFLKVKTQPTKIIIITEKKYASSVIKHALRNANKPYKVEGVIIVDDDSMVGREIKGVKVVATGDDALEYICRNWVDEVFIDLDRKNRDLEQKYLDGCLVMGLVVDQNLGIMANEPGKKQIISQVGEYTVLSNAINITETKKVVVKRLMDVVGGIVGTIITGILCIIIGPLIYIKSPGPIFFKQTRIGQNGKKFKIYKFRSMYMDAEERKAELMKQNKIKDGMMFKMENDPRIIGGENGKGIGNFIRNHSIDEFPQFINVLKGDMSLVGTRPPTLDEWEKYDLHHRKRMAFKPGITGLWQVSGRSKITDFEEVVKLDAKYITNWSVGMDLMIILKTVGIMFTKDGAS